jgi:hypothetical protein
VPGRPDDGLPLVELSSPSECLGPSSSAFVAPGAPPSPFRPAWGFSRRADSRNVSSERPSRGVRLLFRVRPPDRRPLSFSAPSRRPPKRTATGAFRECGIRLSWVSCSHEHRDAGCPVRRASPRRIAVGEGLPTPRRCRPQGSCPSRRFGLVMLATRTGSLRTRPCAVAPDASRPCFMPLASLERPSELSLPEEPYPLSRASCFLAGFALRSPPAQSRQEFTSLSPQRQLFALTGPPGGGPRTHEPGPRFPATLRSAAKTRP